jgi:segregation and condensation protein B
MQEKESTELLNKIEAALFLAARFLTIEELVRLTDVNPITMRELLKKLERKYNTENSALTILKRQVEGQEYWKMDVKNNYSHYINKIASGKAEFTKAEKGTLAVIAYKQPIKQSIIVKIRGNKAYDHVRHFVRNDLVKARRLGRTYELTLSERFYDYFNIKKEELKKETKKEVEEQIGEKIEKQIEKVEDKLENANNS